MTGILHDARYALRGFLRNPGFAAAAVLSIALGIGANCAIFSVAGALLLRPLPYRDPDRLVILWNRSPGLNIAEDWFSTAQYFDILNGHGGFEQLAIAIGGNYNLTGAGEPERVVVTRVSSNLLPMLGATPAAGRLFLPAEDAPGAGAATILSYGAWTRRFGGDPRIVGKPVTLNGQAYTIAGVLSPAFSLPREVLPTLGSTGDTEFFLSLPLAVSAATVRTHEDYNIIGKLKGGVSIAFAQSRMDVITARLRRDFPQFYPPNGGLTFSIVPLLEQVVGDSRRGLLILSGAVAFVLLIACANVANLLLSRAIVRQKELAVRAALGAGAGRIARQLLCESLLLSLAGGAAGLLFASWGLHWLRVLGPESVPRLHEVSIDLRVLLFTVAVSLASGILFGSAPAARAARLDLNAALKDEGRGSSGGALWGRGHNLRRTLAAAGLALSVVLLIGAGLLVRSFARVLGVAPGFNARGVLTLGLTMSGRRYSSGAVVVETYRQIWERLQALEGVSAAGGVSSLPMSPRYSWGPITIEGRTPPPGENFINADERMVGGAYFQTMQIPLVRGRFFASQDDAAHPRVAIVDEFMAQQFWPGQDPVGKRIRTGGADSAAPWITIVGVAGRVKQYGLDADSRIALYLPQTQFPVREMTVVVRSATGPARLSAAIRAQIRAVDPDLPVYQVRTMADLVAASLARRRFSLVLLALFAALALGLAALGVYGVISYLVNQGAREMGIRMALGATRAAIVALVMQRAASLAGAGIAAGLVAAFFLARFLHGLLFEVRESDPLTFAAVTAILAAVAVAAAFLPARRAASIDPMRSLRE